jgi:hypothetical protein
LQQKYQAWLDNLPANLEETAIAERLREITSVDLVDAISGRQTDLLSEIASIVRQSALSGRRLGESQFFPRLRIRHSPLP